MANEKVDKAAKEVLTPAEKKGEFAPPQKVKVDPQVLIKIKNVHKIYADASGKEVVALNGVNLEIHKNEFICVVGPSGCGKTTLLNIIAGLEKPTSGEITINDHPIVGPGPDRGVIFQQYALFPWRSVKSNIMYGLKYIKKEVPCLDKDGKQIVDIDQNKIRRLKWRILLASRFKFKKDPADKTSIDALKAELEQAKTTKVPLVKLVHYSKAEKEALCHKYIQMVNLGGFEKAYPKELSGGMKQRVAIARAYALNSEVLLLDEPFGALDAQTRAQLQEDLLRTWEKERKTCFFITHDVDEAVLLATRVIIMSARPGQVKDIVLNDVPYPRTQASKLNPEFIKLKNQIWDEVYKMYLEVNK